MATVVTFCVSIVVAPYALVIAMSDAARVNAQRLTIVGRKDPISHYKRNRHSAAVVRAMLTDSLSSVRGALDLQQ
jgi:hypothetical protein